jgi:GTP cyclohydrolase II
VTGLTPAVDKFNTPCCFMKDVKNKLDVLGPLKLPLLLKNGNIEDFKLYFFKSPKENYHVLEMGDTRSKNNHHIFVRIESACAFAHIYGSQLCDCRWQLDRTLEIIANSGCGIIIYASDQHGRGVGLENHMKACMQQQNLGFDTVEAHKSLGLPVDARDYTDVIGILNFFGIRKLKLLTNSMVRINFLKKHGFETRRIPLETKQNKYNENSLRTKKEKMGHLLHTSMLN